MPNHPINSLLKGTSTLGDLLLFLYDLTSFDLSVLSLLLKSKTPLPLDRIAAYAGRDKSTVFRSVQRMVQHSICVKEVRNLKEGGYYHVYGMNEIGTFKQATIKRIEELRYNIDNILRRFENDLNDMASPAHMRILVAEDEPGIARVYQLALESKGYTVTISDNGEDCMRIYRQANSESNGGVESALPFDVVILDYLMPKKDGIEVAKEILSLNPTQRIIFASAYLKETILESLSSLGQVIELLPKPVDIDILTSTVEDRQMKDKMERMIHAIGPLKNTLSEAQVAELFNLLTERIKNSTS